MSKKLNEMSLEELWRLFPISLVAHKNEWEYCYNNEKDNILSIISDKPVKRISHIGSTAVPDIWAKNIVDILLEVYSEDDLQLTKEKLLKYGWLCMNEDKGRISMNKGYTPDGYADKVFHLHIRLPGDNDELYFRDYLIEYPETAKEYEKLKLSLADEYKYNRDGYTEAKSDFIKKYTAIAKNQYGNRY